MMSYWIFKRDDGTCLAVEENHLEQYGISDDLGELVYDEPMPRLIARLQVAKDGGQLIPEFDATDLHLRFPGLAKMYAPYQHH